MLFSRKLLASLLFVPLVACAAQAGDDTGAVKKAFADKFPQREVASVSATPVKGVYEIVLKDRQIVYTDSKVDHMFVGDLVDVKARKSLTEERMNQISRIDWKDLPLELAIKDVRGNGARKLVVFSDPDCPFCKKLEKEGLAGLDNVTIYTFLFPITQLHPDAMSKSEKIWCSKDRLASWHGQMLKGTAPAGAGGCDTPLARLQELGQKLGVTGTPALVFPNGQLVPGAIGKADIEKLLSAR